MNSEESFLSDRFNRLEILIEGLAHQIQVVAEGVIMNNEKIDRLQVVVSRLEEEMIEVKGRLALVEHDVSVIKKTFATRKDILPMKKDVEKLNNAVFA